jgi:large subunit ribosomal protein L28
VLEPPPYPYGPARWFKQSNRGLYGGASVRFGNNVSERTKTKTRRTWHPNVVRKNVFCAALNRKIRLRLTTRVLRTIDKVGGLDEYLLGEKEARIKELGLEGWKLRWAVMMSDWGRARLGEKATELGLPEEIRLKRGWMKKSEFEKYILAQKAGEESSEGMTGQDIAEAAKFEDGKMSEEEQKDYLRRKAQKEREQRAALWDDPEVQKLWLESRGTRVLLAKSKTQKGKEIQRVMVLKEAVELKELKPEEVEEWTEEDDAKVGYDTEELATLGEEETESNDLTARHGKSNKAAHFTKPEDPIMSEELKQPDNFDKPGALPKS